MSEVGTYSMALILSDTDLETRYIFTVTIMNNLPYFGTPSLPVSILSLPVGSSPYEIPLPLYADDDGTTPTISYTYPSFVTINSTYIAIAPTIATPMGTYTVTVTLRDSVATVS